MYLGCRVKVVSLAVGAALASAFVPVVAHASATPVAPRAQAFGFSNSTQHFTVPAGVHQIHLTAWGGSGGNGGSRSGLYAAPGGVGAEINLDAPVNPGDTLAIDVGGRGGAGFGQIAGDGAGAGGSSRSGGPGGNINSRVDGTAGGGGGGATTVVDTSSTTFLIAGGGGGGGGGGGTVAGYNGGQGGDAGTTNDYACDPVNGAGVYGSGLTGGAGGNCAQPQNGPRGVSGSGEAPSSGAGTGGGGGGGLNGGDGGASGGSSGGGAGGGGAGSSFWSSVTSDVLVTNGGPAFGGVIVSWSPVAVVGIAHTVSFSGCCAPQTFTVPAGVTQLTVTGWGGSGGAGARTGAGTIASRGGYGAVIREVVAVDPGDTLAIDIGGAGGVGAFATSNSSNVPIPGGAGGMTSSGAKGGQGGSVTVKNGSAYAGATGGGGGGSTRVRDMTTSIVLLHASGGGGGGGGSEVFAGANGGPGGNAGSPLVTGDGGDGNGYFGSGGSLSGASNGSGGRYASASSGNGEGAADSTAGNVRGTGGGGGGGVIGGGAGQQCTGFSCALSAGGGAGGSSTWASSAQALTFGNSLAGGGGVRISWIAPVATTTAIASNAKAVVAGTPVTLTATVSGSGAPAGDAPNGRVIFVDYDTGLPLGSPVSVSPASPYTAKLTATLPAGIHHVYASYLGDSVFGPSTSAQLTQEVIPGLSVTTTSLPGVELGAPYSVTLGATGGVAPYTWTLSSGELPTGLRLDPGTGEISGTPTAAGRGSFTVRATDAGAPSQTADVPLSVAVGESTLAITAVTPGEIAAGAENVAVTLTGKRFLSGAQLTASDRRIALSAVTIKDLETITAQVTAPAAVPAGAYDLTVTEGAASATCTGCLRVTMPAAVTPAGTPATSRGATPTAAGRTSGVTTIVRAPFVTHRNQVRFTASCAQAVCYGQATETVKGKTVAAAAITISAGATRTITLKLNATGRALLARFGRLSVHVTVTQRQPDGKLQPITSARLTVRPARARHR
jgi:hypothetical protein